MIHFETSLRQEHECELESARAKAVYPIHRLEDVGAEMMRPDHDPSVRRLTKNQRKNKDQRMTRTVRFLLVLLGCWIALAIMIAGDRLVAEQSREKSGQEEALVQPPLGANPGPSRVPAPLRPPRIVTHIPSTAGGEQGIAVGVLPPLRPRYADGAPIVIHVPGGVTTGGTEGRPEYAGLGFVEIRFAFPGGGRGEGSSGGTYDYRGPNCLRALADVIRFASGSLADRQGRKLQTLIPRTNVSTRNVGILGSSHGGNACGLVMATHGDEFPDLAFYASMESPYGEGNVNIELGGRDQGVNPAYDPETGQLNVSKLAWSADLPPGPPRRWQDQEAQLKGSLFFDLNGDGRFASSDDYPANTFIQDLGQGPKAWYTPRLVREAEERKLYGEQRPAHVPSLAESTEYWRWRDAAGSIAAAVSKCPDVAVIVYANERDHVQVASDHPHILAQVEGFRQAGAKFVRLNPDRAYIERILASGGPSFPQRTRIFPDNEAGTAWNRGNIRNGLEPEDLPMQPYMQAAVCELADRVQAGNWANNLDAVLYPNAPWTAFVGREFGGPAEERSPQEKPPLGPGGLRPPLGKPPLRPGGARPPLGRFPQAASQPLLSEDAGAGALRQQLADDAGSPDAPLLFCIGVHVEPLGATVSTLARMAPADASTPPRPARTKQAMGGGLPGPSYEQEALFLRHVADLQTLAGIVERRGGKLTIQAQTPFTRQLVKTDHSLFRDLQQRGHELALHFHEDAHLGFNSGTLPPETWTAVMREELDWLKRAGATRVRYWSGGNLYPQLLDAASRAGLDVMSDFKNPRTQRDDERLLTVNPWRPAEGPNATDLAGFAHHQTTGPIIYLPNGVFERTDHSAMRRSADLGGDYPYFDALTRGLELSLRAARPDRVNVFHITVHAGEFRGGPRTVRPFAVIDDWLGAVVAPAVRAGKVRWATFSEMADTFAAWEKKSPHTAPRASPDDGTSATKTEGQPTAGAKETPAVGDSSQVGSPVPSAGPERQRGYITFVVNTHDWGRVAKSADTILRLIEIFSQHHVRGDFYLTAPVVEAYATSRPEVLRRLRDSRMTISYHFRPPHPAYSGFDATLRGLDEAALRTTLRDYETFRLDLATGGLDRGRPGGYAYVKQMLEKAPVTVSAMGNPRAKAALLDIYREWGAQMTMEYHESGTSPAEPFVWRQGLLIRPSDFSITRWAAPGEPRESFWWSRQDTPQAAAYNPTARLRAELAAWQHPRAPLITALIHENDFYVRGGPSWNAIYLGGDGKTPQRPPYDLNAPDQGEPRTSANQDAIWRAYEDLVAYAAQNLAVVTSAEIVSLAEKSTTKSESP